MSIVVFLVLFGLVFLALILATDLLSRSEIFSKIISIITPKSRSEDDSDDST